MYPRSLCLLCTALLAGGSSNAVLAQADSQGGVRAPPRWPVALTLPAVDHVITYSSRTRFGPKGGRRITIWRDGSLMRELAELQGEARTGPEVRTTSYWNLATGGHARDFVNANGSSQFHFSRGGGWRYRLDRTDETRTVAGERCRIWRTQPFDANWAQDPNRLSCVTDDGVLLYEAVLDGAGKISEERTALTVERRNVSSSEVLPPKEALDWAAWQRRVNDLPRGATGRPENYEVRLKQEESRYREARSVIYRASDGWFSTESWPRGERQDYFLRHASGALGVNSNSSSVILFYDAPNLLPPVAKKIDRKPSTVLGEECHWFNAAPDENDHFRYECRAKDGLPLIVEEGRGDGGNPKLVAVTVSRGSMPLRRVMLPPGTLSWVRWGWSELEPKRPARRTGRARPTLRPSRR